MVKRNIPISRIGVKGRIPPLVNKMAPPLEEYPIFISVKEISPVLVKAKEFKRLKPIPP